MCRPYLANKCVQHAVDNFLIGNTHMTFQSLTCNKHSLSLASRIPLLTHSACPQAQPASIASALDIETQQRPACILTLPDLPHPSSASSCSSGARAVARSVRLPLSCSSGAGAGGPDSQAPDECSVSIRAGPTGLAHTPRGGHPRAAGGRPRRCSGPPAQGTGAMLQSLKGFFDCPFSGPHSSVESYGPSCIL